MHKRVRWWWIVAAIVAVLVVVLAGGYLWFRRQAYPRVRGHARIEGLDARVDIYRDPYGVPHLYATTAEDLFFAQGYVHAQDRFWQMEFWRRIGAGRLSELFGEATLSQDIYLRTMGFARLAEFEYEYLDDETRVILEAYARGVNAYIEDRRPARLGIEFALLGLMGRKAEIEPWTPVHTLAWAHVMAQDLTSAMDDELRGFELLRLVGRERAGDLWPAYPDDFPYVVPDEVLRGTGLARAPGLSGEDAVAPYGEGLTALVGGYRPGASTALGQGLALGNGQGVGSNNWTVSGWRTETGAPILANDPHLGIQMPSIWYEVGLHCDPPSPDCPYQLRGYSFAGVPGIVLGHNDRIAWGMTNVDPDVQDLYIERLNPDNVNQYEVEGRWEDMDVRYEEIRVCDRDEPLRLAVRSTRHGPVITDIEGYARHGHVASDGEALTPYALALRWTALEPMETFRAILMVNRARSFDEFREAMRFFDAPSQHFVYADVDGNIGYQLPGRIPVRGRGDGTLPVPGWSGEYEWLDEIPFDELPYAYNPPSGYIASANQPPTSDAYVHRLAAEEHFDRGYRAERIVELLERYGDRLSADDVADMQGDVVDLAALRIVASLDEIVVEDEDVARARDMLLAWDGALDVDSPEAALYGCFFLDLMRGVFEDELPMDLWPSNGGSQGAAVLVALLERPSSSWWDDARTPTREGRDEILARALEDGLQSLVERQGENPARWSWGALHTATFENQTLGGCGIGPIEALFNRGPFPVAGGPGVLNACKWDLDAPFGVDSLPSMRQIIDLGDLSRSRMVHTTGQSGHPGHRHYDDFIEPWLKIAYHPTYWLRADVEADAAAHLRLVPR